MKIKILFALVWLGWIFPIFGQDPFGDSFEFEEDKEFIELDGVEYRPDDFIEKYLGTIAFSQTDEFTPESYESLDKLAELMNSDLSLRIEIGCHLDDKNSDESSRKTSQNRANAIKNYLTVKNVDSERITPTGFGRITKKSEQTSIKIIEFLSREKYEQGGYYNDYLGGKIYKKGDLINDYVGTVVFELGTDNLDEESFRHLDHLAQMMLLNKAVRIEVGCHYNVEGASNDFSLKLTQKRAKAIRSYLQDVKGVELGRIVALGLGRTRPDEAKTPERTEFRLIALNDEDNNEE